ncbi:Restriction endonuclease subunit S [Candidatus Electrothrix aarhusensis]
MRSSRKKWEYVTLEQVCQFQNGFAFKSKMFKDQGTPVLRISSIQNEELCDNRPVFVDRNDYKEDLRKYEVHNGDLVIAMSGATTGKIGFNKTGGMFLLNQRVGKFAPSGKLDIKFLFFYLIAEAAKNLKISVGSAQPNLSTKQIKNFLLPLPPVPEQKRIVAILNEAFVGIDQAVANTEKNLANAREVFESYLNVKLLKIASQRTTLKLTDLTELIVDCEHKTAPTQSTGYPSIRTPNIGTGELLLEGVKRVSEETYRLWTRRAAPKPNDLILAREAPAGNIAVIPKGEQVCLGQRTVLIRPQKDKVIPSYLAYLVLHPLIQKRLLLHSRGATVQHINMKDIRRLSLGKLPSLEKQASEVKLILEARKNCILLESIYQKKLIALAELKQSILQKAFTGELTQTPEQELTKAC